MTTQEEKERLKNEAHAEYQKNRDSAWAEYENAWAEYEKKIKEIEEMK